MSMSLDETICTYFVQNIKKDAKSENQFSRALELMRKHLAESQIRLISSNDGFALINSGLTKKDVFVFALFEGEFFEQLQTTKALIVGPPCIVDCLTNCEPIPLGNSPVYSTAMRDLKISATGITANEKEEISKLIHWMGGHYFQNFGRTVTHLISNTIKSNKYEYATVSGVPVMHVDWIKSIWNRSSMENCIKATDSEFDKYRLPTFFGANITCSGLDATRRENIIRLVNENGGIYHRAFRSQLVDIVITEQSKTDTEKYKAAMRFKKDVLLPEWIFHSHERGYALPTKKYEVRPRKHVSTPTKTSTIATGNQTVIDQTQLSDISRISYISGANAHRMCNDLSTVNETMSSTNVTPVTDSYTPIGYLQTLAEISPSEARKAGNFLDGCCIYLSGFQDKEREKLHRVLNTGGATRYDEAKEGVTHIIVGQIKDATFRQWQRDGLMTGGVHVVRLDWLLESIKAGSIVNELIYRVLLPNSHELNMASPASKRTLRSMNHSFKQPKVPTKKQLFTSDNKNEEPDVQLLTHYSQEHEPMITLPPLPAVLNEPAASSTHLEVNAANKKSTETGNNIQPQQHPLADFSASLLSIDFDNLDYFKDCTVYVCKETYNEEFLAHILGECEAAKGNVVGENFVDMVDYAIVSSEMPFDVSSIPVQARFTVTELYMESCMKKNKLVPIEYYHLPIPDTVRNDPLKGMTVVVSIYCGLERDFVNNIAELLGARVNKTFIKKEKPLLICPEPKGSKYEGAIKWGYPIVNSNWLVQCAKLGEKVPFQDYLVGSSSSDFRKTPNEKKPNINVDNISNTSDTCFGKEQALDQNPAASKCLDTVEHQDNNEDIPAITPLRNRRVSELAMANVRINRRSSSGCSSPGPQEISPQTPLSQNGYNFDFLDEFVQRLDTEEQRECVREIIQEMRENRTPELERIRRLAATPVSKRAQLPTLGIPNFCLTPEFQQRMADDFERRWRLPSKKITPDTPITEIRQRVMRITCETLGIAYPFSGNEETQQNPEQTEEEESENQLDGKHATPLQSRSRCVPGRILFEKSPEKNTSQIFPSTQSPMAASANSTINFEKISFEETPAVGIANTTTRDSYDNNVTHKTPELKQITDYLKDRESRRNSLKRTHSRSESTQSQICASDSYMESEVQYVQPFESEGFTMGTGDMVSWRDPAEFNAAKRRSSNSSRMQHQGIPCFSISCSDNARRQELIDNIHKLGGKVCENLSNYDASCTHLLCERPNRGEKMLGCIATGKWILFLNYIDESIKREAFIDEELCEWGNAKAQNLPTLLPEEAIIATAANNWRIDQGAGKGEGAFFKFRFILNIQERSKDSIKNVIKAGGGLILNIKSPFGSDLSSRTATHCLVDKKTPLADEDFAYLDRVGVKIMSHIYLNAYLMNGRTANLDQYVLHR